MSNLWEAIQAAQEKKRVTHISIVGDPAVWDEEDGKLKWRDGSLVGIRKGTLDGWTIEEAHEDVEVRVDHTEGNHFIILRNGKITPLSECFDYNWFGGYIYSHDDLPQLKHLMPETSVDPVQKAFDGKLLYPTHVRVLK